MIYLLLNFALVASNADLESRARKAMADDLKDPMSAQFMELREIPWPKTGGTYICGKVNAKNGFGGYTGFHDFLVTDDTAIIASDTDPKLEELKQKLVSEICKPKT